MHTINRYFTSAITIAVAITITISFTITIPNYWNILITEM